jgi:hypothetical protein
LIGESTFRHLGWKLSPEDDQIIRNCIARLIQDEKVRTHRFDQPLPALRLQPAVVIARKDIADVIHSPTHSFDSILNHLFALSLLVGTGARAGDIGYADDDGRDKALQIGETELYLAPGDAVLHNVVLRISITHYKGNR